MTRDFAKEMRDVIDAATEREIATSGGYVPRKLASDIANELQINDPELLSGWLTDQAEHILWRTINDIDRSGRMHARATAGRRAFASAAGAYADGNPEPLREYMDLRFTVEDGTRRPLRHLRGPDLMFVSGTYSALAKRNTFMATVMQKLAEKVGSGTVEEHYDDAKLESIFGSFEQHG